MTQVNAERVAPLARWGKGIINGATWSPDGRWLAVASSFGIYLYEAPTLAQVRFIETAAMVYSLAFSPDGALLAAGMQDNAVELWRVSDGTLVRTLGGHTLVGHPDWCPSVFFPPHPALGVAFSPDGAMLAFGSTYGTVWLWRVSDGTLLRSLTADADDVTTSMPGEADPAFSPDGRLLAAELNDGLVRLWRVSDGSILQTLRGHTDSVNSLVFSSDGRRLASGSADGTIRLWGVAEQ